MFEAQPIGMQGLPSERVERSARRRRKQAGLGFEAGAIGLVAQDRMPDVRKMHADLVGAAGFQRAGEQARHRLAVGAGKTLQQLPMGDRVAPAFAHRALVARMRVAFERGVDDAARPVGHAPDEGKVAALQWALGFVGELRRQCTVRLIGLGHHHQPAGVLVEAVHDAGPLDAADAGQAVAAMRDQRVDQRALGVAGGGMHDQAGRLVDHDERVVLVNNIERDIFARSVWAPRAAAG